MNTLRNFFQRRAFSRAQNFVFNVILKPYSNALERYPKVTKCLTSGVVMGAGDFIGQVYYEGSFDKERLARYSILGAGLVGPSLHYWYNFLGRMIPGTQFSAVIYRIAVDQLIFAPCFIGLFIFCILLLEGRPELVYC